MTDPQWIQAALVYMAARAAIRMQFRPGKPNCRKAFPTMERHRRNTANPPDGAPSEVLGGIYGPVTIRVRCLRLALRARARLPPGTFRRPSTRRKWLRRARERRASHATSARTPPTGKPKPAADL